MGEDRFAPEQFGIFSDSEALADASNMDLEQSEDYYGMARKCEGCGQKKQCRVDWVELYCLQYGVNPHLVGQIVGRTDVLDTAWVYDPQLKTYHPNYRCNCHGQPLVVFNMTPREAERVLHAAGRNGILSDEQKRAISAVRPVVKRLADGMSPHQVAAEYRAAASRGIQGPPPARPMGPPIRR